MLDNFGVVLKDKLYRCAQPQQATAGYHTLRQLDVNMLIQLNGRTDVPWWGGDYWGEDLSTWHDFQAGMLTVAKLIQDTLAIGWVIAVHCLHGRDRTGGVIAAWRILYCGWSFEDAQEERLRFGSPFIQWIWDEEITEFLKTLTPGEPPKG